MIIESDYRGYRIEVNAIEEDGRWQADVRMRRLFSPDKPRHETVTCYKLTPDLAEHAALIWAKRWVDANGGETLARKR